MQANKKMQEINLIYEVLSDLEKRKRYDKGESSFSTDNSSYGYEEEIRRREEELKRNEEELKRARREVIDIKLQIPKAEMRALDRCSTIGEIGAAFCFTFPQVHKE